MHSFFYLFIKSSFFALTFLALQVTVLCLVVRSADMGQFDVVALLCLV